MIVDNSFLLLENERYQVQVFDPNNRKEKHFSTRYSHCGYIGQIVDKTNGKALLGVPTDEWNAFSGDGFPDEFEMPVGYENAVVGGEFLKIGVGRQIKDKNKPYNLL